MKIPSSTYRIQLHRGFTFRDLESIIDYLHTLGISTIYAAPIFQATPGSMHGYDVTDPHSINADIGTLSDLRSLAEKLRSKNMSWIQDIVPNHMAFNPLNFRLMDVLERGPASPYYHYFDIDWTHPSPNFFGKLQVPFLGDALEACIEKNEIKVSFSEKGFTIDYLTTSYPLSLSAFEILFSEKEFLSLKEFVEAGRAIGDHKQWRHHKRLFISSVLEDGKKLAMVTAGLTKINSDSVSLSRLLDYQYYRLTHWQDTANEINYRRFFTVNDLICLRMEDADVFNEYHSFIYSLYKEDLIQGLRVDHIDGLRDPSGYISRLRNLFGEECYMIAEKILESKEAIPNYWPLQGTSGYEFLGHVNRLMTSIKGAKEMLAFYVELVPQLLDYKDLVWASKQFILQKQMAGEWNNITRHFIQSDPGKSFDPERIKQALGALMIAFPVYRIYPDKLPLRKTDWSVFEKAFDYAAIKQPDLNPELDYLHSLIVGENSEPETLTFLQRLMQFTGPLTAKGVEDTTFYIYHALLSHDEVGDSPYHPAMSISAFHQTMSERQQQVPLSLNATSTHDTKRGEDARLRLNVLCEFTDEWKDLVKHWFETNTMYRSVTNGRACPSVNDEYFIYQSIIAGFPEDFTVTEVFLERLIAYQTKALREAKTFTDWAHPDTGYEAAYMNFIRQIMKKDSTFLQSMVPFLHKICERAYVYSLSQVLIKLTAPGIPDIYQGCELWDLSFVDPDNRRPVDFQLRAELLDDVIRQEVHGPETLFGFLKARRSQGMEKLFLTSKVLNFRRHHAHVFTAGTYLPLQIVSNVTTAVCYARHTPEKWVIVICPLAYNHEIGKESLSDHIILPETSPGHWVNVLTGEEIQAQGKLYLSQCLKFFPMALLTNA